VECWTKGEVEGTVECTTNDPAVSILLSLKKPSPRHLLVCPDGQYDDPEPNRRTQSPPINYDVTTVQCPAGSILLNNTCQACPVGYYSFDVRDTVCHPCKSGMICNGGNEVSVKPGFWRKDNVSEEVYACFLAENCLGGPGIGTCKEGYGDRLCGVCSDSWLLIGQFSRPKCQSETQVKAFGIATVVGLVVFLIALLIYSVKYAYRDAKATSKLLELLLTFVQELVIISNLDLQWPSSISNFLSGMKYTAHVNYSLISYSFMYGQAGSSEDPIFNNQQAVLFLPLALYFLFAVFWGLFTAFTRNTAYLTCHLITTISVVHTTFLLLILNMNLNMLSCAEMEHGTYWLLYDLRVQCWVGRHLDFVVRYTLPSMLVWCFALPVGMLGLLVRNKSNLSTPYNRLRFSFLLKGHKLQLFFWPFLLIFKKCFILTGSVLFPQENPTFPAIAILLFLLIYMILLICFRPSLRWSLNATEVLTVGATIAILLAGLVGSNSDSFPVVTVFAVVAFLILGLFFLYFGLQMVCITRYELRWRWRREVVQQYEMQLYESRNPVPRNSALEMDVIGAEESVNEANS